MKSKVRDLVGPTPAQLRAIEAEWPLIAAEIAVVAAEIAIARVGSAPTALDGQRLARAQRRVLAEQRGAAGSSAHKASRLAVA